jgi:hypothetical protein
MAAAVADGYKVTLRVVRVQRKASDPEWARLITYDRRTYRCGGDHQQRKDLWRILLGLFVVVPTAEHGKYRWREHKTQCFPQGREEQVANWLV